MISFRGYEGVLPKGFEGHEFRFKFHNKRIMSNIYSFRTSHNPSPRIIATERLNERLIPVLMQQTTILSTALLWEEF